MCSAVPRAACSSCVWGSQHVPAYFRGLPLLRSEASRFSYVRTVCVVQTIVFKESGVTTHNRGKGQYEMSGRGWSVFVRFSPTLGENVSFQDIEDNEETTLKIFCCIISTPTLKAYGWGAMCVYVRTHTQVTRNMHPYGCNLYTVCIIWLLLMSFCDVIFICLIDATSILHTRLRCWRMFPGLMSLPPMAVSPLEVLVLDIQLFACFMVHVMLWWQSSIKSPCT